MRPMNDSIARPPTRTPASNHKYSTRTRQRRSTRSPAYSVSSPEPPSLAYLRKIKPAVTTHVASSESVEFPPQNITLHPEDAFNKIFLAIGRSLMAVGNRAVTVRDLSEMVMQHGLVCQNVSASSQAITTYMRMHVKRCEDDQDAPLLLRHVMSGGPSDDDLLPALHSHGGGAQSGPPPDPTRKTNFRKGTAVWYLSRATGAPCPFAQAGIRISDYSENGKCGESPTDPRERRRERDRARRVARCGEKRKRLTRSCTDKGSANSDASSAEEEQGPPKLKLKLRIPPMPSPTPAAAPSAVPPPSSQERQSSIMSADETSDSDSNNDESMSDSSDDSVDRSSAPWFISSVDALRTVFPVPATIKDNQMEVFCRSPSIPSSAASAPPDSEDEDDRDADIHRRRLSISDMLSDTDDDGDGELDWMAAPVSEDVADANMCYREDMPAAAPSGDTVRDLLDTWEVMDKRFEDSLSRLGQTGTPADDSCGVPILNGWTSSIHPSPFEPTSAVTWMNTAEPDSNLAPLQGEFASPSNIYSPSLLDLHAITSPQRETQDDLCPAHPTGMDLLNTGCISPTALRLPCMLGCKTSLSTAVPSPLFSPSCPLSDQQAWSEPTPSLASSASSSASSPLSPLDYMLGSPHLSISAAEPYRHPVEHILTAEHTSTSAYQYDDGIHVVESPIPWDAGLISPAEIDSHLQSCFPAAPLFQMGDQPLVFEAPPLTCDESDVLRQYCNLPDELLPTLCFDTTTTDAAHTPTREDAVVDNIIDIQSLDASLPDEDTTLRRSARLKNIRTPRTPCSASRAQSSR